MISLVPKWAHNYDEFWNTIRRRNLWFIKLRYTAVLVLIGFVFAGQYLMDFYFTDQQVNALLMIALSILIYNSLIHAIRLKIGCNPDSFNCMHLSLIQMLLDLTALMLLVYYTGTIFSPLNVFFIFHMVIGSLILPNYLVYVICGLIISIYSSLIYYQYIGALESHYISGLYLSPIAHNLNYNIVFVLVFSFLMLMTVILANRIAGNLLKREGQLREMLDKLDEQERTKQKHIMGIVHEIKSPITAAESLVDLILQNYLGPISEPVETKLLRVRTRLDDSLYLINNILKISKLRLLNESFTNDVDINTIIRKLIDDNIESANKKRIKINFLQQNVENTIVEGEASLLELALSNVLGNSIKYTETGGRIDIKLAIDQKYLSVSVVDDGIGIPEKEVSSIYKQFFRASNTRRYEAEGSGLGLSLVKEIIQHHNGIINVKSPSGIGAKERPGTNMTIKLPFVQRELDKNKQRVLTPLHGGL
ncbi:MAG: HAMP domain-containing histidine kinase [Bacteroidetes bacterium]|nr:HAMP domain-containing histidine kinase [Bacteroidota bacterium]